ncbi:hypothetical protein M1145_00660 [Patescibacteria group bacterium]|nr:hypothetical protein [Patescibacteria group bacterium]
MNRIKRIFNKIRPRENHLIIAIFITLNILFLFLVAGFFVPKPIVHAQTIKPSVATNCGASVTAGFASLKVIVKTSNGTPLPNDLGLHTWTDVCENYFNQSGSAGWNNWYQKNYYNGTYQDFLLGTPVNIGNNALAIDKAQSSGVIAHCPSSDGCAYWGGYLAVNVLSGPSNNASSVAFSYYEVIDCGFSPANYQLSGLPTGWTVSGSFNSVNFNGQYNSVSVANYIPPSQNASPSNEYIPSNDIYTITLTPPAWQCSLTLTANPNNNLNPTSGSTTLSGVLTVTDNGTPVVASGANQPIQLSMTPSGGIGIKNNPVYTGASDTYSTVAAVNSPPFSGTKTFTAKYRSSISGITCSSNSVNVTWEPLWKCTLTLTASPSNDLNPSSGSTTLSGVLTVTENGTKVPASAANQKIQISDSPSGSSSSVSINNNPAYTGSSSTYSSTVTIQIPPFYGTVTFTAKYTSSISGITCSSNPVSVTWGSNGCTLTLTANPNNNLSPTSGSTTLSGVLTVTKNGTKVPASAANQKIQISDSPSGSSSSVSINNNPTYTGSSGTYSSTVTIQIPPFYGTVTFTAKYVASSGITCSSSPVSVTWGSSSSNNGGTSPSSCTITLNANPLNPQYPGNTVLSGTVTYPNGSAVPADSPVSISQNPSNASSFAPSTITTNGSGGYSTTATLSPGQAQSSVTYTATFNSDGVQCSSSSVTVTWGSINCAKSPTSNGCEIPIQPKCNRGAYKELYVNGSVVGFGGVYNYRDMGGCNPSYPSLRISYNLKYISLYNINFIRLIGHNLQYWMEEGI